MRPVLLAACLLADSAVACDPGQVAARIADAYHGGQPAAGLADALAGCEAREVRARVVERLGAGGPAGYKVALTSAAAQAKFGVDQPVLGELRQSMLLTPGVVVARGPAERLLVEGDLMVQVRDGRINDADTDLELLAGLRWLLPFVELPAMPFDAATEPNGELLVAINAGARSGVVGSPVELPAGQSGLDCLVGVRVRRLAADGSVADQGGADALLGHPIKVVRWLRDRLRTEGRQLRAGDLISLGTITPLKPAMAGAYRFRYSGLCGAPDQLVEFSIE